MLPSHSGCLTTLAGAYRNAVATRLKTEGRDSNPRRTLALAGFQDERLGGRSWLSARVAAEARCRGPGHGPVSATRLRWALAVRLVERVGVVEAHRSALARSGVPGVVPVAAAGGLGPSSSRRIDGVVLLEEAMRVGSAEPRRAVEVTACSRRRESANAFRHEWQGDECAAELELLLERIAQSRHRR